MILGLSFTASLSAQSDTITVPNNAEFYLRNSNSEGEANIIFMYGAPDNTWIPLAGDWDGDGITTIGLFEPILAVFHLRNSNSEGVTDVSFPYGQGNADWLPVVGAWQ